MRAARLRLLGCALAAAGSVAATALVVPAATAAPRAASSQSLRERVSQLSAEIDRVGAQLAAGATAYEKAEDELAVLTQKQFAARASREELLAAEADSRTALQGLARAAYKGGVPPMVSALLSGDPGALGSLAYVQRSVNRLGATRTDVTRELAEQQAGAGQALVRSDRLRRDALAKRQAVDKQRRELAAETARLTESLQEAGAELIRVRAAEQAAEAARQQALAMARSQAAAERAARAAAAAIAAGRPFTASGGGLCQPPSSVGEVNGWLSDASLCPLQTAPGHRLRTDAARAFDLMSRARQAAVGTLLCVTDSYRSYPEQVDVFARKPQLAATPGRSQHGWGLAVDLGCGVQGFGSEAHRWMQQNAPSFGWIHPAWAQRGGSRPEAWHWEYVGAR